VYGLYSRATYDGARTVDVTLGLTFLSIIFTCVIRLN
jgi:hypothetical protein